MIRALSPFIALALLLVMAAILGGYLSAGIDLPPMPYREWGR